MKRYALIAGNEVLIDQESMLDIVTFGPWYANSSKIDKVKGRMYFGHNLPEVNGKRRHVKLHRIIAGAIKGQVVDHKNGNTLDCTRDNLRLTDATVNVINAKQSSPHPGLYFEKAKKLWRARIHVNGKSVSLGRFKKIEDAQKAYREAEKEYGYAAIRERRIA